MAKRFTRHKCPGAWFFPRVIICQLYSRTLPFPIMKWSLIPLPLNLGKCVICLWPREYERTKSAWPPKLHQKRWCFLSLRHLPAWSPSHHRSIQLSWGCHAVRRPKWATWKDHMKKTWDSKKRGRLTQPASRVLAPHPLQVWERPWGRTTQLKLSPNSCLLEIEILIINDCYYFKAQQKNSEHSPITSEWQIWVSNLGWLDPNPMSVPLYDC